MERITEYRRNLPHINPENAVFFITYRLAGSLPKHILEQSSYDKEISENPTNYFEKLEALLDSETGELLKPEIAEIVTESLWYYDKKYYTLLAYCIMHNHVHLLINTNNYPYKNLFSIMKVIKGVSARKVNKFRHKTGQLWHHESYDRMVRDRNELASTISYIKNNPVKAGLVENWKTWKYTYVNKKYLNE